jgi:hypothetical protein
MCEPITMAAIAAVGTAAQISAQNEAAQRGQEAAVETQKIKNAMIAEEAQDKKKVTETKLSHLEREALRQKSAQTVAMAESGAAGGATLRNMANVYMQKSFEVGTAAAISEIEMAQIGRKSQTTYLETKYKIDELEDKKTTGIAAALQIGASAASGYASAGGFADGATLGSNWADFKSTWSSFNPMEYMP